MHDLLLEEWAEGEDNHGLPVVVLTDLKTRAVSQYPFDIFYAELWKELSDAKRLIAGGYGFRDLPVNAVIRAWLLDRDLGPTRTVEVWAPQPDQDEVATALHLDDDEVRARLIGIETTLPSVAALQSLGARLGA
jgi:hypothetical protein